MKKLVLALMLLSGCATDTKEASRTLYKAGFKDVRVGDLSYWGCGQDDLMGRHFRAMNPSGDYVDGIVCCAMLKGCTVRF